MIGYSGSYAINGVNISQPETGQWEGKDILGRDGAGRPIYSAIGDFTLSWGLMSTSDLKQINDFYLQVSTTGTASVDLPKWGDVGYMFTTYSGTFLTRPTVGAYFSEYVTDVKLVVLGIRVP